MVEGFVIQDFAKGHEWRGMMRNGTVHDCGLFNMEGDRSGKAYCPVVDAVKVGEHSIGESFKFDMYNFRHPHEKGFFLDVEANAEFNSLDKPAMRTAVADVHDANRPGFFFIEREEYWDINRDPIDPAIFTVPAECPRE